MALANIRCCIPKSLARTSSKCLSTFSGEYLSVNVGDNGVALVRFDDKTSKVNTLSANMTTEILRMLDTVEGDNKIKSVVLISSKPDCFIAGADIAQLQSCKSEKQMKELSQKGQQFLGRIAKSKKPFVAAINGSCMGGGLEVALACHYRIATQNTKTLLSLPEVMLGLLPGAGGTQRLPRLIGLQAALDMMLTGKNIRPDKAKRTGLVDQLTDPSALENAAISAAQQLADGKLKSKVVKKSLFTKLLEDNPLGRKIVIKKAGEMVDKKTGGKYPAPRKIIEAVQVGLDQGMDKGLEVESSNFGHLGMTSEAAALMSIFFGQKALKKNRFGKPTKQIETIGVVGAGLMGAGIAQVSAQKGMRVLLKDRDAVSAGKGEDYIKNNLASRVKKRQMTKYEQDAVLARVLPLSDESTIWQKHFSKADLVIEAVFEDMALKHKVIQDLEEYIPEHCIIATNTSALSLEKIAKVSKRPENVIGMHYFSPVPQMPLLEIIRHQGNPDHVCAAGFDVGLRQGKTCIVVKDVPGFYVNRCLGPFMAETLGLVQSGVDPVRLDKLVKDWGMPVGPITLADEVGIDVAYHVNRTLAEALGVRMHGGDAKIFEEMINNKFLGKKTGKGFYLHQDGKKGKKSVNSAALNILKNYQKTDLKLNDDEIINRIVCRFVNEAILCVQDEIISSPTEGNIGAVFGIGFPPFIGGPFRLVDRIGSSKYNDMMLKFAEKYGEQFTPCALLQDMAKTNKTFE